MPPVANPFPPPLSADYERLEAALPRVLRMDGMAEGVARDWSSRVQNAIERGAPGIARYDFDPEMGQLLFEVRRSRQLIRGLESAEEALASQELGLSKSSATQVADGRARISRLLVVSEDGSSRFYNQIDRLRRKYSVRLEVLMLGCDERVLGAAVFGGDRRARALLLDHKDAVARMLALLSPEDASFAGDTDAG